MSEATFPQATITPLIRWSLIKIIKKENFTKEIIGNKTDSWRKLMLSILINESTTDRGLAAI